LFGQVFICNDIAKRQRDGRKWGGVILHLLGSKLKTQPTGAKQLKTRNNQIDRGGFQGGNVEKNKGG